MCKFKSIAISDPIIPYISHDVFTLPDTETKTDTDTEKLTQNPMWICVDVCPCAVWTPLQNFIQPIFYRPLSIFVPGGVKEPLVATYYWLAAHSHTVVANVRIQRNKYLQQHWDLLLEDIMCFSADSLQAVQPSTESHCLDSTMFIETHSRI